MSVYLKYYQQKNPKFGKPKPPFVPPTREEYEEYLDIVSPSNAISPYEEYVERSRQYHETPETEILISSVAMGIGDEEDKKKIDEIESSEYFIRWFE